MSPNFFPKKQLYFKICFYLNSKITVLISYMHVIYNNQKKRSIVTSSQQKYQDNEIMFYIKNKKQQLKRIRREIFKNDA